MKKWRLEKSQLLLIENNNNKEKLLFIRNLSNLNTKEFKKSLKLLI